MNFVTFVRSKKKDLLLTGRVKFSLQGDSIETLSDDELLSSILFIDCSFFNIESIPDLLNCTELVCKNCSLMELYAQLPKCNKLECSNNSIVGISSLPNCTYFECQNNDLGSLPELENCKYINCSNNKILSVAKKYDNCEVFICNNNRLKKLPKKLPNCIRLECYNNNFGSEFLPHVKIGCVVIHEYKRPSYIYDDENPTTSSN